MHSSLDYPDLLTWRILPDYSFLVARQLVRAYAWIAGSSDRMANYLRAANEVTLCLAMRMAVPQRLRVLYVEAQAYAADNQGEEALEWTDGAIELAIELDDWSALATLLYLRGALNAAQLRFAEGALRLRRQPYAAARAPYGRGAVQCSLRPTPHDPAGELAFLHGTVRGC